MIGLILLSLASSSGSPPSEAELIESSRVELRTLRESVPPKQKRDKEWPSDLVARAEKGRSDATTAWVTCAHLKAFDYSKLTETAGDVATASLAACSEWIPVIKSWTHTTFEAQGLPFMSLEGVFARSQESVKQRLTSFVMDLRLRPPAKKPSSPSGPNSN